MAHQPSEAYDIVPLSPSFSSDEQEYLADLARFVIGKGLLGEAIPAQDELPKPTSESLQDSHGVYVTLMRHRRLRGSLGLYRNPPPLHIGTARMAFAAAFGDRRFTPLDKQEWCDMQIEISILGAPCPCPSLDHIVIGQHGLILEYENYSTLLLPQAPVEQLWDVPQFIHELYTRLGLPWDPQNPLDGTHLSYFTTQTFVVPSVK